MRAAVILKKALKSQGKCFLSRVCVQGPAEGGRGQEWARRLPSL